MERFKHVLLLPFVCSFCWVLGCFVRLFDMQKKLQINKMNIGKINYGGDSHNSQTF